MIIEPSKLVLALHHLPRSCGKFKPPTNEPDLCRKRVKEHRFFYFNRLMLYRKIMVVCSYNNSKYMNVLRVCVGGVGEET